MADPGKEKKGFKVFLGPSVRVSISTNPKPTPKADAALSVKPSNAAVVPEDARPGPMPTAAAVPLRVGMFQRRVPGAAAAGVERAAPPPPPTFPGDMPLAAAPSFEERVEASAKATLAPSRAAQAFLAPKERNLRRRRALDEIKRDITEPIAKVLLELKDELDAMKEGGQDIETKEGINVETKDGATTVTFQFSDFTVADEKLQTLDSLFETLKIRQSSLTGKGDLDTDSPLKRDIANLKKLMDFAKTYLDNKEEIEAKKKQQDLQLLLTPEIVNTLKQLKQTWNEMTEGYSEPTSYEPTVVGDRYTHVFEDGNRFPLTEKQLEDLDLFFISLEIRPDRISGVGKFSVQGTPFQKDLKTLNELFALIEKPLKPAAAPPKPKAGVATAAPGAVTTLKGSEFEELATAIEAEMDKNPYQVTDTSDYTPQTYGEEKQPKVARGFVSPRVRAFSYFIKDKFKPYELPDIPEDAWDFDACAKMTSKGDTAEMYAYQKFVRDYMSFMTPYRGVLVYHGLGSGKTCTAIAAAEALFATKAKRRIIVMTPGALRKNFIQQITFCGFRHFRLQNHWVGYSYVSKEQNALRLFASSVLKIPQAYLDRKDTKTIWIPDFSKEPNYDDLTGLEQLQIREQINNTLIYDPHPDPKKRKEGLIWFITYNGVTAKTLKEIACRKESKGEFDTFDNSVIIVDEIHNMVRLMQGVIDPYLTKLPHVARKAPFEPIGEDKWDPKNCGGTNTYKRGYLFYRLLVEAKNSKIIGLSGTPLINFPEELGILANVLHGYNHIYKCVVGLGADSRKLKADLEAKCKANPYIDFYDIELTTKDIQFRFIFLPEGYVKVPNTLGVVRADAYVPLDAKKASVQEDLKAVLGSPLVPKITVTVEPLLPPFAQYATQLKEGATDPSFKGAFIADDEVTVTNRDVLIKRLTGLISYYRGSRKDLMPEVISDEVIRVPMSEYQQQQYARIRVQEIDIEKKKESMAKQSEGATGLAGRAAEVWAENFEVASLKSSQNYRMASRQACNFVFPGGFTRPRPEQKGKGPKVSDELGGNVEEVSEGGEQTALIGTADEEEERRDEERAEREAAEREDAEIEARLEKDYLDTKVAELRREGKTEPEIEAAREALMAAYRAEREEVVVTGPEESAEAVAALTPEQKRCRANLLPGETYQTALNRAKECLLTLGRAKMLLQDPEDPEGRPSPLGQLSNKYKMMLENINEIGQTKGSSLVYSQFLGMEGIGIFTIAMQANGYDPILLQSIAGPGGLAEYEFTPETIASLRKGSERPRFILFTGSESEQTRKINIDIFNAKLEELPAKIKEVLQETGLTDNKKGQLCRVFCITSAGAEGLSLKNVRSVHIMEPYWNDVRMQQVKGRAVRICSHMDLEYNPDPEKNQRTVEIYSYVSVFDPRSQDADDAPWRIDEEIRMHDSLNEANALAAGVLISRKKKQYVMTSDERLLIISQKKKKVIENLEVCMKAAAADCALNYKENKADGTFTCRLFSNTGDFLYDPELEKDKKKIGEFEQRAEEREAVYALEQQLRAQQLALAQQDERPPLAPAPTAEQEGVGARATVANTLGRAAAALAPAALAPAAVVPPPAPVGPKILAYMQGKKKVAVTLTIGGAKKNFWMKPGPDETTPTHYDLFEVVPGTKAGMSGIGKKVGEIRADPSTGKPSGPPQLSS